MSNIVEFKERDVTEYHFDREKLNYAMDFVSMALSEGKHNVCKCMCSKECIDELIAFLSIVSKAWEDFNMNNE